LTLTRENSQSNALYLSAIVIYQSGKSELY